MKKQLSVFIIMLALAGLMLPADTVAQRKVKQLPAKAKRQYVQKARRAAKPRTITRLPAGHTRILVKEKPYYFHAGVFYGHHPSGYVVIPAPLGARVRVLPFGHTTMMVDGIRFFYYYGAYYRWEPDSEVYYVVSPPVEPQRDDILTFTDGEILHGRYLGGDEESVDFLADNEVYSIPVDEIVSILFEPPTE